MRKLTNLVLTMALAASVAGAASAKNESEKGHSNSENFAGAWYYPWAGPNWGPGGFQENGAGPFHGGSWQKKYSGEVTYVDQARCQIKADGSGDLITFYLFDDGGTSYVPTHANLRVGSKVKVTSDDRHRARTVHVVPFYKWLKDKTK